ncbi:hypothetical protein ACR9PT_13305 [Piscirickettsia salmonis]|uniref:hypothetical protein n=1 Tax=Piscirickettsia salmonis TaxID=1238 RepID=UPI003EBF4E88
MDLNALLKKTKNKAKKAPASKRQRVNIAADDRPYDLDIEETEAQTKSSDKTQYKVDTNRTQTVHKVDTNRTQKEIVSNTTLSEHVLEVELADKNRTQTAHKVDTNRTQKEIVSNTTLSEHVLEAELADKNRTQSGHKVDTNRTQKEIVSNTALSEHVLEVELEDKNRTQENMKASAPEVNLLVGVQKDIFIFIYKQASYHKDRVTRPLTLVEISEKVGCKVGAVKTSIARLKEKNYIMRYEYKNGRGGWTRYKVLSEPRR